MNLRFAGLLVAFYTSTLVAADAFSGTWAFHTKLSTCTENKELSPDTMVIAQEGGKLVVTVTRLTYPSENGSRHGIWIITRGWSPTLTVVLGTAHTIRLQRGGSANDR
jgi:hypothetical protein